MHLEGLLADQEGTEGGGQQQQEQQPPFPSDMRAYRLDHKYTSSVVPSAAVSVTVPTPPLSSPPPVLPSSIGPGPTGGDPHRFYVFSLSLSVYFRKRHLAKGSKGEMGLKVASPPQALMAKVGNKTTMFKARTDFV